MGQIFFVQNLKNNFENKFNKSEIIKKPSGSLTVQIAQSSSASRAKEGFWLSRTAKSRDLFSVSPVYSLSL